MSMRQPWLCWVYFVGAEDSLPEKSWQKPKVRTDFICPYAQLVSENLAQGIKA
ncbi:MAG: hypothetical protein NZ805_02805 [Armatimonadetes bacterium]|nr:hypothetical protein [Armatimonadota bacterium]